MHCRGGGGCSLARKSLSSQQAWIWCGVIGSSLSSARAQPKALGLQTCTAVWDSSGKWFEVVGEL